METIVYDTEASDERHTFYVHIDVVIYYFEKCFAYRHVRYNLESRFGQKLWNF